MAEVPMEADNRKNAPPNDYTRPRTKEEIQRARNGGRDLDKQKPKKSGPPKAKLKEQTFGEKIVTNIKSIDKKEIKKHLIFDWFIPEFIDQVVGFLKQMFYGEDDRPASRASGRNGYTAYGSRYRNRRPVNVDREMRDKRDREAKQNYAHIVISFGSSWDDATEVMDDLREMLEESSNGYVRVKDLYSHSNVGFPTNNTMDNWGWYDLEEMYIDDSDKDDLELIMPKAEVVGR